MANLQIVDSHDNAETGTRTLTVRDTDNPDDPGAMYHYASKPPEHAQLSAEDWQHQVEAHALGLEARSRGVEPPAAAPREPGRLGEGAAPAQAALSDDERAELANERAGDQVARDRAELEKLRAARATREAQPPT